VEIVQFSYTTVEAKENSRLMVTVLLFGKSDPKKRYHGIKILQPFQAMYQISDFPLLCHTFHQNGSDLKMNLLQQCVDFLFELCCFSSNPSDQSFFGYDIFLF